MKFKFKIQQYQTDAVENTVAVFQGQPSHTLSTYRRDLGTYRDQRITYKEEETGYGNHRLELDKQTMLRNIRFVQNLYDITPFGNAGKRSGSGKSGYRDGDRYGPRPMSISRRCLS